MAGAFMSQAIILAPALAADAPAAAAAAPAAAAAAPPAAGGCPALVKLTSMELQALPDGRLKVPVTLVERASTLLLDTGSAFRALKAETATALGITPVVGGEVVAGIPGQANARNVMLPSITLGTLKFPETGFLIAEPGAVDAAVDGRLTLDMLVRFDVDLDFTGNQMSLFLQNHCVGKVVYWQANGLTVSPFFFDAQNRINFPVRIDGTPLVAVLDTNSPNTYLDLDIAKANGLNIASDNMTKTKEVRNGKEVYQRRFKSLSFEDIGINNTLINVMQGAKTAKPAAAAPSAPTAPVTLGMNILRRLHIYVALQERTLYISAGGGPAVAPPAAAPAPAPIPAPAPAQ